MRKLFKRCMVLIFFMSLTLMWADRAEDIIKASRKNIRVDSVGTQAEMHIQKDGNTVSLLKINQYTVLEKNGTQKSFIEFLAPASARGTRFLTIQQKNGAMDQRIYLPSLGKVRRIASGGVDTSASFMGTDFSYDDIAFMSRDPSLDKYTSKGEQTIDGEDCYVIESVSKDTNYSYSKTMLWVSKSKNELLQAEFYNKKNVPVKKIQFFEYRTLQGIPTPLKVVMTSLLENTSTAIFIKKMVYNMKIPSEVFTNRYLEQGR